MVKTNDKEAKRAFAKAHNKKFKERGFKVGDFVLVHFPDSAIRGLLNRKMVPNWKGVFRITRAIGKNTFMHSVNLGIKIHKVSSRCIMNSKGCVTQ